jgi:outer membrane autotransporter protein
LSRRAFRLAAALALAAAPARAECFRVGDVITCSGVTRGSVFTLDSVRVNIAPGASVQNIPVIDPFGFCPISPPVISVGARSTVINNGALLGFGTCAAGISVGDDATVVNTGTIDTVDAAAPGIALSQRAALTNSGSITTRGAVSNGVFGGGNVAVMLAASSSIVTFGGSAAGVFLGENVTLSNAGLIRTAGINAPAVELVDNPAAAARTFAAVTNTGVMETLGPRSVGLRVGAATVSVVNDGAIRGLFRDIDRSSDFSRGAVLAGDTVTLINRGVIAGAAAGVELAAAQSADIVNTGMILGFADIGRALDVAARQLTFSNSGQITGRLSGVRIAAVQGFDLDNRGIIETTGGTPAEMPGPALQIDTDAAVSVFNSGRIAAAAGGLAVRLGDGGDTVVNSGELRGGVRLGGGNDVVILHNGSVLAGLLDGGAGTDRLILFGAGTLTAGAVDLEDLLVAANDRWTLAQDFTVATLAGVVQGELALAPGRTLTAPRIAVVANARLSGSGTLRGRVEADGVLAPGPGLGTLVIGGNLVQSATSVLRIDLGPAGSSDTLAVAGTARLDGTLDLTTAPGVRLRGGERYRLVGAAGGIAGRFSAITGLGGAFLSPRLALSSDARALELDIERLPYATAAQDPTHRRLAAALDGALAAGRAPLTPLFDRLDAGTFSAARDTFEALSPRLPGAAAVTVAAAARGARAALAPWLADGTAPGPGRVRTWGSLDARHGSPARAAAPGAYRFDLTTAMAGLDTTFENRARIGLALGRGGGTVQSRSQSAQADLDHTFVAAYATKPWGTAMISGGAVWGDGRLGLRRDTAFGFLAGTADTDTLGAFAAAAADWPLAGARLRPSLGVSAWRTAVSGFDEGGPFGLRMAAQRHTSLRPEAGLAYRDDRAIAPYAGLTLSYELNPRRGMFDAAFVADPLTAFAIDRPRPRRLWIEAAAGVAFALPGDGTLHLGYAGNLVDATAGGTLTAGLAVRW